MSEDVIARGEACDEWWLFDGKEKLAHGKTIGQVVLRWNVQRGVVVIPKSTHKERIEENYDIWDFSLTDEEMKQISSLDMGYQGTAIKHFDPDFVRMCTGRKIHD